MPEAVHIILTIDLDQPLFSLLPDLVKHFCGQEAGLGVLQAGVVGAQNPGKIRERLIKGTVAEDNFLLRHFRIDWQFEQPIEGNLAHKHCSLDIWQQRPFLDQPWATIVQFLRSGFISRRRTAAYRRNPAICQLQTVSPIFCSRL